MISWIHSDVVQIADKGDPGGKIPYFYDIYDVDNIVYIIYDVYVYSKMESFHLSKKLKKIQHDNIYIKYIQTRE